MEPNLKPDIPSQVPSNTNSPATNPQPTPPANTTAAVQQENSQQTQAVKANSDQPEEKGKSGAFLKVFIIILILFGLATAGVFFKYSLEKSNLEKASEEQITSIKNLQLKYDEIVKQYQNRTQEEEKEEVSVLGETSMSIEEQILGLEDSPQIQASRKIVELYRDSESIVDNINSKNQQIEKLANSSIVLKVIKGNLSPPTQETDDFYKETKPLLTYLRELESFSIKMSTWGYALGTAINEAVLRGADDISVNKLEEAINQAAEMKEEAQKIDTSQLPADMQQDHKEFVDTFDTQLTVFNEIHAALKSKNVTELQKSLISLLSEGTAGVEAGTTSYVSFWQEDETIRSVESLEVKWEEFKESI